MSPWTDARAYVIRMSGRETRILHKVWEARMNEVYKAYLAMMTDRYPDTLPKAE